VNFPELGRHGLHPAQLAKAGVARTLQGVGLFNHLSVLETSWRGPRVALAGHLEFARGTANGLRHERQLREEAMGELERLGIAKFAGSLPSGVPYGIAKKVSIARALMTRPSLLMLDEPASGLDEQELETFTQLIIELKSTMSVLLVEHNMDFVMQLVDQLVVLNFGQVIARGTPGEISHNPDVLDAYLGIDE